MSSEGLTTAEKQRLLGALRAIEGRGLPVQTAAAYAGVDQIKAYEWIGGQWDDTSGPGSEGKLLDAFEAELARRAR